MWINITKEIFDKADFKSLNYLYQILSWYPSWSKNKRYGILIDTEKVKDTNNYKQLSLTEKSLTEFLDLEYSYYVTENSNKDYSITYRKGNNNFNLEESIVFFNQPVSIILENNKNDSEFILAIIRYFGDKNGYNKAQEHLDNGWVVFENAGGCTNIPNFMESFLKKYNSLAKKNNRKSIDYFRGMIIIDSDKEYENQPIKASHKNLIDNLSNLYIDISDILDLQDELLNNNKTIHILEKRMMENYLPKEVFLEIARQRSILNSVLKDWLDAFLNLNNKEQLDFINIPDGNLFGNNSAVVDLTTLWENLGGNFIKLDSGFKFYGFNSNGNLNSSNEGSFKSEMPKWFNKPFITKENLEIRDGNGELQRILEKITALL